MQSILMKKPRKRTLMCISVFPGQNSCVTSMSPDLNPIELIWDQPKQRLDERTPPQVTWQLQIAFTEEWNPLPQNNIIKLVRSVGKRLTNDNISLVLFWIFSNVL
uniref:Tc1-like transposase DDE domain-containing protein n=1 Tax=Oryzias melastigma TaxID=30732 RepID=A0A3B3DP29_ORYME